MIIQLSKPVVILKTVNQGPPKKGTSQRRWFFKKVLCISIHPHESDLQTKFQLIWINIVIVIGICIFGNFSLTSKVLQSKRNFVFFFQFHLFVKWNFRKTESVIAFHKLLRNSGNNPRGGTRPYPFVMQNFTNVCIQGYKFLFTSPNLVFCPSKYRVSYSNSMLYTLYKYGICNFRKNCICQSHVLSAIWF